MGERAPLLRRLGRSLRALPGLEAGLVLAVSGGPDSVALLRATIAARPGGVQLVVAHLNHQLRGSNSEADERFVAELHAKLTASGIYDLRLCVGRCDVGEVARRDGDNIEAVARRERYRWLAEVAVREGARWVATGHTADDQAETVLLRLLRGAGLQGLRGIAGSRPLAAAVSLVRPLLRTTRAEVLAYLQALGQTYREDASNSDRQRTRNRIRHELLPLLVRDYNPAVTSVLGRLATQAEELFALEQGEARALLQAAQRPRAGQLVVLDRAVLAAAPRHRVREVFRLLWAREAWPVAAMGHAAWDRLAGLSRAEARGLDLPGGVRARLRERVIIVGQHSGRIV
jgi:tRNA(Ile)-lysidine synthase